jgi:hypothetical protein
VSEAQLLLDGLRDVIEPTEPAGLSLWLVFANVAVLVAIIVLWVGSRHRRRYQWRKSALDTIDAARTQQPEQALLRLAKLIRKIVLHRNPAVSESSGDAWLQELDNTFATDWFTQDDGRIFGEALYAPLQPSAEQRDRWCKTLAKLVRRLPAPDSDR